MTGISSVLVTRKVRFSASHRYHRREWTEEKNREVFGACSNPFGHGHNYELEVTVAGPVATDTGMVINLRELDDVLHAEVVTQFDHRSINDEVPGFRDVVPTTENIVVHIWRRLAPVLRKRGVRLHRVRLWEDPFLYVEMTETP